MQEDDDSTPTIVDISTPHLIESVKIRPPLYDTTDSFYRDKCKKRRLWNDVCVEMCTSSVWNNMTKKEKIDYEFEIKKRWCSLRNCFRREVLAQQRGSNGFSKKKRRKYYYYDALLFLLPFTGASVGHDQNTEESENIEDTYGNFEGYSSDSNATSPQNTLQEEFMLPMDIIKQENIFSSKDNIPNSINTEEEQCSNGKNNKKSTQKTEGSDLGEGFQVVKVDNANGDGDVAFLQSLLPSMREFTFDQKMELRIEIMRTILKFKQACKIEK